MNLFDKVIEGVNVCLFVTFLVVIESICIYTLVFVCFNILAYTRKKYHDKESPFETIIAIITSTQHPDMNSFTSEVTGESEFEIEVQETKLDHDIKDEKIDNPS